MIKRIFRKLSRVTHKIKAPKAKKIPHKITQFDETRIDEYDWIRDPNWQTVLQNPSVLDAEIRDYLNEENAYKDEHMKSCTALTKAIGDELCARIVPNESGVPMKDGAYEYWAKYVEGGDYPHFMRRDLNTGAEECLLNGDEASKGCDFFSFGGFEHSPDHKYIAYSVDVEGSEYYELRVVEIATGKTVSTPIPNTSGFEWSADSKTIYYGEQDDHHRTKRIKAHTLGTDPATDAEIYFEQDDAVFLNVSKTESGDYILIRAGDSETSEVQFFAADDGKAAKPNVIKPREKGVEYDVHHRGDQFFIHTNKDGATEFKVMAAPVDAYGEENWVDVIPARDDTTVEGIMCFKDYMIREERSNATPCIVVSDYNGNEYKIDFPDPAYDIAARQGYEFDTDVLRIHYETMANPGVVYDVDLKSGQKTIRKEKKLPNGHDPSEYVVERVDVKADDGAEIPVTILRHKSVKADGKAPLFQYGYGSYGAVIEDKFSSRAISLVDRGMVYAVAHIRGGGEKGEAWHKDGKKMTKKNTFTDFTKVTEALIEMGYGQKGEVTIEGRSAGGMLMGAVTNMRPDLYGAVLAGVAFVDVLNTISDETLPLTPPEWEEWGNPIKDKTFYEYMKSYSPYDNIRDDIKYPMIIAPAGLTDPRVTYWEPAKWIAKLRDTAKGGPFILKMNMSSGHFGSAARYDKVRESADEYALCLQRLKDKGYNLSLRVNYKKKSKTLGPKS